MIATIMTTITKNAKAKENRMMQMMSSSVEEELKCQNKRETSSLRRDGHDHHNLQLMSAGLTSMTSKSHCFLLHKEDPYKALRVQGELQDTRAMQPAADSLVVSSIANRCSVALPRARRLNERETNTSSPSQRPHSRKLPMLTE